MLHKANPRRMLRILIIEDDAHREAKLVSWLPPDIRAVVTTSAGKAIGILSRDRGSVYAGIILDFDLQLRRASASELHLCGHDVVLAMIEHITRDVQILVHSENTSQSPLMVRNLQQAGFDVTQVPMRLLTAESLSAWLDEVRSNRSE